MRLIGLVAFLVLVVAVTVRSPIGQRHDGKYSPTVLKIGQRRPPRVVAHPAFLWLTRLARRTFPILNSLLVLWGLDIFAGRAHIAPIHFVDLLTVNTVLVAIMLAGLPFMPRKRNGPLSLWMAWAGGTAYAATALAFPLLVALAPHVSAAKPGSYWLPLQLWAAERSWSETAGVCGTLLGVALGFFALGDGSPDIGDPETTPADLGRALGETSLTKAGPQSPEPRRERSEDGTQVASPNGQQPPRRPKRRRRKKRKKH